jgi:uncharacterized protein (TIGR03437 family)
VSRAGTGRFGSKVIHNSMKPRGSCQCRLNRRIPRCLAGVASILLAAWCQAQAPLGYTIATVAGNGTYGYSGDAGPATGAQLFDPYGVVLDNSGNLYIADQLNNRIRKVSPDGTITTVAGNGTSGYTGDGGAATSAELYHPCGLALDSAGNLYIADAPSNVIRKLSTNGTIATVAGNQTASFAGDGAAATSASLNEPLGVAVDAAGNIYIADSFNSRIRMVANGTITTLAGNSFIGLSGDGGAATSATLNRPQGVAVDAAGNVYIADTDNHVVRKVAVDGTISTVAGNGTWGYSGDGGPATQAALFYPKSVAVDAAGNLYIADTFNSRIRVVAADGTITTVAGNGVPGDRGDGGPATSARLKFPSAVALDAAGNLYIADTQNSRIRLLAPASQPANAGAVPAISTGRVAGAAAFGASTSVAPGSWIELYGSNLAASSRGWTTADFNGVKAPTSLDGTRVTIGGQDAFIAYISPTLVSAQLPSHVGAGPQQITVTTAVGTSAPYTVTVNPAQPGLLPSPSFQIGGKQYVAALLSDGATYVLPPGAIPGAASRPAHPGETIVLYGAGFGPVSPSVDAGEIVRQNNALTMPVQVFFGQMPATVSYAGLAVGAVGLYQFNVVVPNLLPSDAVPVTFTLAGVSGGQTLYTAVQN